MLQSKQHSHFGYRANFCVSGSLNDLVKRGLYKLVYLFIPQDTTAETGRCKNDLIYSETSSIRSVIKSVFWVVVSIMASLALGQLK